MGQERRGEPILLEDNAILKRGLLRNHGIGRLYLTPTRLMWKSLLPMPLRLISYLAPREIVIELSSIRDMSLRTELWRAWLVLNTSTGRFVLRPGKGSILVLEENPETTMRWLDAIQLRRKVLSEV